MLKRYFLTAFFLLLLLISIGASLLPLLAVRSHLDEQSWWMAVCIWQSLALFALIPLFSMVVRRVWFFRGKGEPMALPQLRERLLSINTTDCPVTVRAKRKKLIITWRIQDNRYCEALSQRGISTLYELHCRFDTDTRTVFLLDRIRRADLLICLDRIKIGRLRLPLPLLRARSRRLAHIEQYAKMAPQDYVFHPREIKSPIIGTLLASGWNVRFSLL